MIVSAYIIDIKHGSTELITLGCRRTFFGVLSTVTWPGFCYGPRKTLGPFSVSLIVLGTSYPAGLISHGKLILTCANSATEVKYDIALPA